MATLAEIGRSGFAGLAPTPVLSRAINQYLVHDELMNLMQFVNIGMASNVGNIQASYVIYEEDGGADFRSIGAEYEDSNAAPKTGTVELKMLGGSFNTDRVIDRAFGNQKGAVTNWIEGQCSHKINAIKTNFSKYFITGNATTNAKQFDGLNVFFTKYPEQVADEYELKGLTRDTAISLERYLQAAANKIKPGAPNCIITTETGKTLLQTLNAMRNGGVEVIEVNSKKYSQWKGMPIIALPDSFWAASDVEAEMSPVVFLKIDEFDGVRAAVPMDGKVIDIIIPTFDKGSGTLIKTGACEMVTAPVLANPWSASKCFITEVVAPVIP